MNALTTIAETGFDVDTVRRDFPILASRVHDRPLVYLDNAATTQKPQAVIDAIVDYYTTSNANIHRGVHRLSVVATDLHDEARQKVKKFLNAGDAAEIISLGLYNTRDDVDAAVQAIAKVKEVFRC